MRRKIIKLAEKTLVVSLPTTWLTDQGLKKGDELDCSVEDNRLVLNPLEHEEVKRSITIDISTIDERVLRWQISSLHKQGYDEIILSKYSSEQASIVQDLVSHLFIGFIIKEQSQLRIVVGEIARVDVSEFDTTLRRAFRLLLVMIKETKQAFEEQNKDLLQQQILQEKENNKLTNFCERLLNKHLLQKDKGHFWYVIAWNLEKIADNFKYIAQETTDVVIDEQTIGLFGHLYELTNHMYELFYSFSFDGLVNFNSLKKNLHDSCLNLLKKGIDPVIVHYIDTATLQVADFSASMIALRYEGHDL